MQNIDEFIDRIVAEKKFETKDPEVLAQIKADLAESVGDHINAMIMSNIKEEKLTEFEEILDTKDEEKITKYIREQIPDIDEKTASVLLSFRTVYTS